MGKLKIIKKVLITLILISTIVLLDKVFVKYTAAATDGNNKIIYWNIVDKAKSYGENLFTSNMYYCIEHNKHLNRRYKYSSKGNAEFKSDETGSNSRYYRAIAQVLYDGINNKDEKGNSLGGYNQYSKYQLALWILINDNKSIKWPYLDRKTNKKNSIDLSYGAKNPANDWKRFSSYQRALFNNNPNEWNKKVNEAKIYLYGKDKKADDNGGIWATVKDPEIYSDSMKDDKIIGVDKSNSSITFNNNVGEFKLDTLHENATVTKVTVTYTDNNGTKTDLIITDKNYNTNGIFTLSKKPSEIKKETVYITNIIKSNTINNVSVTAKFKASGHKVNIDIMRAFAYWAKNKKTQKMQWFTIKESSVQLVINPTASSGKAKEASIYFNVNQIPSGDLEIIKEGVHGETDLKARFNLYCENTKGYVSINNGVFKYNDVWNTNGTFETGIKISGLRTDYTYTLFEVAVEQNTTNGKYYVDGSNNIKMKSVKINDEQPIEPKTKEINGKEYYYTPSFDLVPNKAITVTIKNDDMRKDLKIVKKDLDSKKELDGAQMKIFAYEEKKWLQGPDGNGKYTFTESVGQAGVYTTSKVVENGVEKHGVIKLDLLPKMKYYIYEIKAPDEYSLADQYDSNAKDPEGCTFNSTTMVLLPRMKNTESEETKYFIDLTKEGNEHTAVYDISNKTTGSQPLTIIKKNSENGKTIAGVKMAIYYYKSDSDKGWLSGTDKNTYNYNSNTSEYITPENGIIELSDLKEGKYYIFETAVPEGFSLTDQTGSTDTKPNIDVPDDWVYLGYATKENEGKVEYQLVKKEIGCYVYNDPLITLDILKVDSEDANVKVKGAQMRIYTKNPNNASDNGWLAFTKVPSDRTNYNSDNKMVTGKISVYGDNIKSTEDDITVEYNNNDPQKATIFETDEEGQIKIEGLKSNIEYYVYEIKAPDGYNLTDQPGYENNNEKDPNEVTVVKPQDNPNNVGGVYVDHISHAYHYSYLTPEVNETNKFKFTFTNISEPTGIIEIFKEGLNVDGEEESKKLNGAEFILYYKDKKQWYGIEIQEGGKRSVKKSTNVSEIKNGFVTGTDVYISDATEQDKLGRIYLDKMPVGTYYVIEIKAPSGYTLKGSTDIIEESDPQIVKDYVKGDNYLCLGTLTLSEENKNKAGIPYICDTYENEPTNGDDMDLKIIKIDSDIPDNLNNRLDGAKVKIFAKYTDEQDKTKVGWLLKKEDEEHNVTYDVVDKNKPESGTTFITGTDVMYDLDDEDGNPIVPEDGTDGIIYIDELPKGEYYIYEIDTPEGYDKTAQDGYRMTKDQVLKKTQEKDQIYDGNQTFSDHFQYVFCGKATEEANEITVENKRVVSLKGFVWVDRQDTKESKFDYIYKKGSKDIVLKDIPVTLNKLNKIETEDEEGNITEEYTNISKIAETKTNENGEYQFDEIKYWDLENAFIKFEYDNRKYIVVDPFKGNDLKINSKAQELQMTKDELKDEKLDGKGSAFAKGLLDTKSYNYDSNTKTIEGINLGLLEKREPTFRVSENLAYVKLKINDFTYTYNYQSITEDPVTESSPITHVPNAPTVQKTKRFSAQIYPSDIAQNTGTEKDLQVYVVYNVGVENIETTDYDDIYVERNLFLNSLTNKFNLNGNKMYELSPNDNEDDVNSAQFKRWATKGEDEAVYKLGDDDGNVFKGGIGKQQFINTYIQFKLKPERLKVILEGKTINNEVATAVTANGYHEYQRTDNLWKHTEKAEDRMFEGVKGKNYPEKNKANEPYYTHKSISKDSYDNDISVKFNLGKERYISGFVFEDLNNPNRADENVGNGIKDENEKNFAKGVKVELLDKDKNPAVVYPKDGNAYNKVTGPTYETDQNGKYTFRGLTPGYYYIRFTYGDDNKFSDETIIKSADFKSTIIYTDSTGNSAIKSALEAKEDKKVENSRWYKSLNHTNYSTAVDDFSTRKDKSYNYDNHPAPNDNIKANTPLIGITIENTDDDKYLVKAGEDLAELETYQYEGFNLGLIKQSHDILIDKSITNVDLSSQMGSKLVSDDPANTNSIYIKNNPGMNSTTENDVVKLAQDVSIETEPEFIYGSLVKTTYKVAVKNNSPKDYIEDEKIKESGVEKDNPYYGYYYKYGIRNYAHPKTIEINVFDIIDPKYQCDAEHPVTIEEDGSNSIKFEQNIKDDKKYIDISGWGGIDSEGKVKGLASGEKAYVKYSLSGQIGDLEKNTNYNNDAQVAKLEVDKLTTIESNFEWKASDARLAIFPDTGENRSYTFLIVGVISFATLAIGFVLIKKKVLN